MSGERLPGYQRAAGFDEAITADLGVRAHYGAVFEELQRLSAPELASRERLRDAIFRRLGITFAVYGDASGSERTWPMDLVPRILPASEWSEIERGLAQRIRALNMFLDDLYVGERAALRDGIVPAWLVYSSDGFVREAVGLPAPHGARCVVAGIDLVRDYDGTFRVLEDNLRTPSGISYVLQNRAALTRVLPRLSERHRIRPVHQYGSSLLNALHLTAPRASGDVARGRLHPGSGIRLFGHAFLAQQMGAELCEGRDLVVEDQVVHMRTTRGLERVDVIYRRVDDAYVDPALFRQDSVLGVPGLILGARARATCRSPTHWLRRRRRRQGGVSVRAGDDPLLLGEEPILPNVETYLLWTASSASTRRSRLDQLVVKPVAASGGYGIVMGPQATADQLEICRKEIEETPRAFIARELVQLSSHPTFIDGRLEATHRPAPVS
jgi:uncharacterized circularly permuted ATP-grasp superfamily protein